MTDNLTDARLAEIEARCEAATEGPWEYALQPKEQSELGKAKGVGGGHNHRVITSWVHGQTKSKHHIYYETIGPYQDPQTQVTADAYDAVFIAHSRQDIPDLLAAIRAERKECERLRALVAFAGNLYDEIQAQFPPAFVADKVRQWRRDVRAADALKGEAE